MTQSRSVFIVSDRTGITAETLAHSLLSQFPRVTFRTEAMPFVDSLERLESAVAAIDETSRRDGVKPLVFTTLVDEQHRERLHQAQAVFFDLFDTFLGPLERELEHDSSHSLGLTHGMADVARYTSRIGAVNYSMHCDDGINTADYENAALILTGVSRSGKTPTCLYLALHFGLYAANYPLTEEDLELGRLPDVLRRHRNRLFGLSIEPTRLHHIREERRGNSRYSELRQCRWEVEQAEALYRREAIPFVEATSMSIEEISTTIIHRMRLHRDLY